MAVLKTEIRSGVYYDSAKLMQLQRILADLPGVEDAGGVMGTESNKEILTHIDLVTPEVKSATTNDLVIVVRAENDKAAATAIGSVDEILSRRKEGSGEFRPRSLETAIQNLPDARWVLISVAGRFAAALAKDALSNGKHVFLFSDNVSVEEEIELKSIASQKGLLVMGPDCGTAIIKGACLGFANKVPAGPIGVVAAAGTGLQQVTSRIAQLGSGITHGIGTGGRDLSEKVGAVTFKMAVEVLSRDLETKVIVMVSKPPAPKIAEEMIKVALHAGKPVVVNFVSYRPSTTQRDNLWFATGMDDAARLAVELAKNPPTLVDDQELKLERFAKGQRYLRGLFSGGTLAYEAQHILADYLPRVYANAPINKENKMANSMASTEHSIIDLGEDEFTVGRLHPMMDNELRIRRLYEEAKDPDVAVIMMDVVIGYGSHPDPASELAPAIKTVIDEAEKAKRHLEVITVVTGTDDDPQTLKNQIKQLKDAGAWVSTSNEEVCRYAGRILRGLNAEATPTPTATQVDLASLQADVSGINIGLESFYENLKAQNVPAVHVEWSPPAGDNEKLKGILERMKAKQS
ncbi:MAG: acyl-CoA synthetase FdrA [Anaerolineaceae bacterium]|nr:acyl-CoA synthetase FdrA [Anaerolineaceae bacterium]